MTNELANTTTRCTYGRAGKHSTYARACEKPRRTTATNSAYQTKHIHTCHGHGEGKKRNKTSRLRENVSIRCNETPPPVLLYVQLFHVYMRFSRSIMPYSPPSALYHINQSPNPNNYATDTTSRHTTRVTLRSAWTHGKQRTSC